MTGSGPQARHATAEFTLGYVEQGVRTSVVRLPPTNHGVGDNGFIASLIGIARDNPALAPNLDVATLRRHLAHLEAEEAQLNARLRWWLARRRLLELRSAEG